MAINDNVRKLISSRLRNRSSRQAGKEQDQARSHGKQGIFSLIRSDIRSVFDRDPAARSTLEILLCYSGLHAVWGHRFSHWLWNHGRKLPARWFSQFMRGLTGIEIHPGAQIGPDFFIDHGMGVVIGETAEIGARVTLYHGVTLGGTSLNKGKRHPTLEDNVVVGAGAKVLGAITIGANSRIGANAVVVKSVPPNSVVVGVPGQVVARSHSSPASAPDLEHGRLPDAIGDTLITLIDRVEQIEKKLGKDGLNASAIHAPEHGIWHGEDFSI
jgi:serine O-acetyltransferase